MLEPREAIDRLRSAFGGPGGHRTLHAKGRFYAGTFTATSEATALCRASHLDGRPHDVLVRWSNASGNADQPDGVPDIRGMALKLSGDDGSPFDLLGQTSPVFPTDDPEVFVQITEASRSQLRLLRYMATHPGVARRLLKGASGLKKHRSFAETTFYPLHAYGWLDAGGSRSWVRYVFEPAGGEAPTGDFTGPDRLFEELAARLALGPVAYDVWVTVAAEGDDPHHVTSQWQGARRLLAGRLSVTSEVEDPETGGRPTVFDPTREVDGIELSDDPVLHYRRGAYTESVARRTS